MVRKTKGRLVWACLAVGALGLAPPVAAGCDSSAERQFDFWVGEWTVKNPDGSAAGTSSIRRELGGCLIREHYRGEGGFEGQSLNHYQKDSQTWRQVWVDNTGQGLATLDGRFADGRMVLEGTRHTAQGERRNRITWSVLEGGGVRQLWESSADGGKTWELRFDGRYFRR
jgi:hypothetical protein